MHTVQYTVQLCTCIEDIVYSIVYRIVPWTIRVKIIGCIMEESCCIIAGFIKISFSIKSPSVASLCPSRDHEKGYICWDVKNRKNFRLF
jgi:hypothetical protein